MSPSGDTWQSAYLALSAVLGESLDDAVASLGDLPPDASAVLRELRSTSREARARAMARRISEVVLAIEAAGIA